MEKGPEKYTKGRNPRLFKAQGGEWRLTTFEKKRILLNNIFGVDIDPQAVEVTKLSLLLKVLEGESEQTLSKQLKLFHERALPDLDKNIRCGNSLIGPDFYHGKQIAVFDDEERYRINVFDWEAEFPEIMKAGGFDVVMGNPPYVRQEMLGDLKEYFRNHYAVYHGVADLYAYFIERGVSLLKAGGLFSYIVANKWMRANYGEPLRVWMKSRHIDEIVDFGDLPVFQKATTYPCIVRIASRKAALKFFAVQVKDLEFDDLSHYVSEETYTVDQNGLADTGWSLSDERTQRLLNKIRAAGVPLGEYVKGKIYRGVLTGLNEAFVIDTATKERLIAEDPKNSEIIKPFLLGRDIKRYQQPFSNNYLILFPNGWTTKKSGNESNKWTWLKKEYPAIAKHLEPYEPRAEKRCDKGEFWWELRSCDYYAEFESPKLILPDISLRGNFIIDMEGAFYCVNTAYIISNADPYLLGLMNSSLITFFYKNLSASYRGGYLRFIYQYLIKLPVSVIDFSDHLQKNRHDKIVTMVDQMLSLHRKHASSKTAHEKTAIQRRIDDTDRQIDLLVYELYGLTADEIKIVEGM